MASPTFWKRFEWWGLGFIFVLWTVLLLRPEPATFQQEVVAPYWRYPLAKSVHVGFYALLAGWGLRLVRENRLGLKPWQAWWPLPLLTVHAAATEFLQTMVKERTGSVPDVGWDHLGIILGGAIWRLAAQFQLNSFAVEAASVSSVATPIEAIPGPEKSPGAANEPR